MNIIFDLDGTLALISDPIVPLVDAGTLRALSEKYTLCIVTGSARAELVRTLTLIGVQDIFADTFCITASEIPEGKASGVPFFEMKRRISGRAVMIGDSDGDEIGSKLAGIPCVRVSIKKDIGSKKQSLIQAINDAEQVLAMSA